MSVLEKITVKTADGGKITLQGFATNPFPVPPGDIAAYLVCIYVLPFLNVLVLAEFQKKFQIALISFACVGRKVLQGFEISLNQL
jgi:hypothetical protein